MGVAVQSADVLVGDFMNELGIVSVEMACFGFLGPHSDEVSVLSAPDYNPENKIKFRYPKPGTQVTTLCFHPIDSNIMAFFSPGLRENQIDEIAVICILNNQAEVGS